MKIIIDTDACNKCNVDVGLMLYLISLKLKSPITLNTFEKARKEHMLKFTQPYDSTYPFPPYVSTNSQSDYIIDTVEAETRAIDGKISDDRLTELANKLRQLYPEGKKPGYAYTWRDSTACIVDRLKKFFLKYGEYTDDDIVDATKRYIASFNGDYRYMQLLKYFIWKNKVTGAELIEGRLVGEVEKQSQLASYLENKEENTSSTDWDIQLK